jgi:hypothetical protein
MQIASGTVALEDQSCGPDSQRRYRTDGGVRRSAHAAWLLRCHRHAGDRDGSVWHAGGPLVFDVGQLHDRWGERHHNDIGPGAKPASPRIHRRQGAVAGRRDGDLSGHVRLPSASGIRSRRSHSVGRARCTQLPDRCAAVAAVGFATRDLEHACPEGRGTNRHRRAERVLRYVRVVRLGNASPTTRQRITGVGYRPAATAVEANGGTNGSGSTTGSVHPWRDSCRHPVVRDAGGS